MDYEFAGPTKLPYVSVALPVIQSKYVTPVSPSYNRDCAECLRTALGCNGSEDGGGESSLCTQASRGIVSSVSQGCFLSASVGTPVPPSQFPQECASVCSPSAVQGLEYGEGFSRPFVGPQGIGPWAG